MMRPLIGLFEKILDALRTKQLTPNIVPTAGTVFTYRVRRCANVVMLILSVRNTNTIAPGGYIFQATVGGIPLPAWSVSSACYFGNANLMAQIDRTGVITLRNTWTSSVTIGSSNYATFSFTYIIDAETS